MAGPEQRRTSAAQQSGGMAGAFRLARLFGVNVYVHWSWTIIFLLVAWTLATGYLPDVHPEWTPRQRWSAGILTSLLFFGSVLSHELSHSLEAKRRGIGVRSITLFLFGGVSSLENEAPRARDEFWVAIVGPLTSFAVALVFGLIWFAARSAEARLAQTVFGYLAYINISLGVFNLLPGFPLDGGRVFRALVWGRKRNMLEATRIASNVGRVIAGLMVAFGLVTALIGGWGGLWLVFIGWFLWNSAETAYQQLLIERTFKGLAIEPLIEHDVPRIPPNVTLREFAHDHILRRNRRAFFVSATDDGDVLGLITLSDLRRVPEDEWGTTTVYRAMTPRERMITATTSTEPLAILQMMAAHNVNQVPIYEGRDITGLVTRGALVSAIQIRGEMAAKGDASS